MFQIYINGGRDNASKLQIRQWGRDPICFEARPGRVLWFAGVNFTNSIMRIRLLTRLSNASVRISEKKNCVGNFCISGNGRLLSATTDRGIPTTTLRGGRNRFAPDLHNSACAWTLDRILSCVESCVFEERLMGTGWITIHWGIYGSEEEERKQMQMHAIRGEVSFFFFFLVFLTSLRFCLWVSFCKVGGISKGGRLTVRQSYRWYKSNDAIKV